MSAFVSRRVSATATISDSRPSAVSPPERAASGDTNVIELRAARRPPPANIGAPKTGWGVGIDAFGSPIGAHAIAPPLITRRGRIAKNAGSHSTRSASLPTSTEPTCASMPCVTAGQIVYFAT